MATFYQLSDAKQTSELQDALGDQIILFDEQEDSTVFTLLMEFTLGDQGYAILQSDKLKRENEVAVFKIGKDADGSLELETIEDDDEWENVAEIYDEMTFSEDD